MGCNSSASGRWARGRGAAERRRLGDGGDPRPPPGTDHAALAGSGGRTGANKVRPSRRRRRRPARGRPPGEVGRRRGKCAGRRVGRGRREHAARGASRVRPVPAAGAELRARSRGAPGAPQVREEEKKGSGAGAGAGRRGEEGTPPCRAGRANGGGGGCIIATLSPRRQLGSPTPEPPGGQRPRGGGSLGGPRGGSGASVPAEIRGSEREWSRWLEAKRSAGRGRRAAGDALFVWSAPGTGLAGGAGARAPGGLPCGAAASARGERRPGEGGGRRSRARGWRWGGREAPGKEPPAPSSHHYRAAFLRMAAPRGAPRRGSAPRTPGRPPAL